MNQIGIFLFNKNFTLNNVFKVILICFLSNSAKAQTNQYVVDLEYYNGVLERMVQLQRDSMHTLEWKLQRTKVVMLKEHLRKKAWVKVAIGETALIAGAVVGVLTGAWIPAAMAVGLVEIFLLVEGKYRLNIKQLKIIRREASGEKLSNYIK